MTIDGAFRSEEYIVNNAIQTCEDVMARIPSAAVVSHKLLQSAHDELVWGSTGTCCGMCCWKCCSCACCCPAEWIHQGRIDMEVASQALSTEVRQNKNVF